METRAPLGFRIPTLGLVARLMWDSNLGISAPATSAFHVYPQRSCFAGFFAGPLGMAITL